MSRIACLMMLLLIPFLSQCGDRSRNVAGHRWTLNANGDTIRFRQERAHPVRDIRTGQMLLIDGDVDVLRLWSDELLQDTVMGVMGENVGDTSVFDSTFVLVDGGAPLGNTGTADVYIYCVADGKLHLCKDYTARTHSVGADSIDTYRVELEWGKNPYRLYLTESQSTTDPANRSDSPRWKRQVIQEFDSSALWFNGGDLNGPEW